MTSSVKDEPMEDMEADSLVQDESIENMVGLIPESVVPVEIMDLLKQVEFAGGAASSSQTESIENIDYAVQPLSIQLLDQRRICSRLLDTPFKIEPPIRHHLPQAVQAIIQLHNDNIQKQSKKKKDPGYKEGKAYALDNYYVEFYTNTTKIYTNIAKESDENPKKTQKSDHIVFIYKAESRYLFALTTGNAWHVVRQYVDHKFAIKIAERVANPSKIIQISRRCLFGENVQEDLLRPIDYQFYQMSNLYYFVDSFKTELKSNSELFKLIDELDREKKNKKKPKNTKIKLPSRWCIRVTTGGIIRILKRLCVRDFIRILELFESYMAGQIPGEPDSSFKFLRFLEPTDFTTTGDLNKSLIREIYTNYIEKKEMSRLSIRHRHLEDFLLSHSFQIEVAPHPPIELGSNPPEIEDIIEKVYITFAKDYAGFARIFNEGEITFVDQGSQKRSEKIIDCIEGEYQYSRNTECPKEMYFKIRKVWYELTTTYFNLLYDDLRKVISNSLIEENSNWWLDKPWTGRKTKEQDYNRLYLDSDGFIVFDQVFIPDKTECCDIMRYTENPNDPIYLYQVKKGFDRDTRVAASQLLIAARSIRSSITMNQSPNYLEKLFDEAASKETPEWRKKIADRVRKLGKEKFMDLFYNRRIVFVLAFVPGKGRSFSEALQEINKGLDPILIQKLKTAGYLDEHERLTNKFHYTNSYEELQANFDEGTEEEKDAAYQYLQARRFHYKSTVAKIELIHLAQNLQNLNFEFKICEIRVEETDDKASKEMKTTDKPQEIPEKPPKTKLTELKKKTDKPPKKNKK